MKHFYLHIHYFSLKGYNKLFYHMTTFFFPLDRKYYCGKPGHTHTHTGGVDTLAVRPCSRHSCRSSLSLDMGVRGLT